MSFIAQPLKCTYPDEESLGVVLSWLLENQKSEVIRPLMRKYEVETFNPDHWYPTQTFLNIAREIYKIQSPTEVFVAIGQKFATEVLIDQSLADPEAAIFAFNEGYATIHRGFHPEQGLLVDRVESNQILVTNNTPWPGELIYGVAFSVGRQFSPTHDFGVKLVAPDEHLRTVIELAWN